MMVDGKGDEGRFDVSNDLLHAVLDHAVKVPSKSSCKRATIEFVGKVFLVSWMISLCLREMYSNLIAELP